MVLFIVLFELQKGDRYDFKRKIEKDKTIEMKIIQRQKIKLTKLHGYSITMQLVSHQDTKKSKENHD